MIEEKSEGKGKDRGGRGNIEGGEGKGKEER